MERGKHWIATRWFKNRVKDAKHSVKKEIPILIFQDYPDLKKINKLYSFVAGSKILCCLLKNKQHYSKYRFSHNKNSVVKCSSYKLYSILETVSKKYFSSEKNICFKKYML